MTSPSSSLTAKQRHALFDILTHSETYSEIENFKSPDAVTNYGYPFAAETKVSAFPPSSSSSVAGSRSTSPAATARSKTPQPRNESPPSSEPGVSTEHRHGRAGGERKSGGGREQTTSTSPLLQTLLTRLILPAPGVRDLSEGFWKVRIQGLLWRLGKADLSESYDKGALGLRKNLATLAGAVIEMLGRGILGGLLREEAKAQANSSSSSGGGEGTGQQGKMQKIDLGDAKDLEKAWDQTMDELIYEDLVDGMFEHLKMTQDFESYSPCVEAASRYTIIHLAAFLHHIFIVSPEGQYLLKLIENVNNLVPYKMVKQTLRVGNAATMINGMIKLLLTKLSVGSITNWVGLTANAEDGMNLLQRIISLVLSWDANEFKKSADKIERAKGVDRPTDEMLAAIRSYVNDKSHLRGANDTRKKSLQEHESIVMAICQSVDPKLCDSMTSAQHAHCLEYLSAHLSIRDRETITSVLCRQSPDLLTNCVRDCVSAYEPMIRTVHSHIDLREHLESTQGFIEEFIKTSKPKKEAPVRTGLFSTGASPSGSGGENGGGDQERMASVEDYVDLLMNNRHLSYKWIHALATNCPDIWEDFRHWVGDCAKKFRKPESSGTQDDEDRSMEARLDELVQSLSPEDHKSVVDAVDEHARYLQSLFDQSRRRLQQITEHTSLSSNPAKDEQSVITKHSSSSSGPGVYLSRWQDLLDDTIITPADLGRPSKFRSGEDVKNAVAMGKTGVEGTAVAANVEEARTPQRQKEGISRPDVSIVVKTLGGPFRQVVRSVGGPD